MEKHNKKLYISLSIILVFFIFFIIPHSSSSTPKKIQENTQSATLSIDNLKANLSFPSNATLYDALMQAKNAGKITFSGKNYLGLGFFMTDIGTLHTGNGKNLIYYINGKVATVGVSSYILKDGDIIEWKLE